ncbi:MAG TPA: hypothetical protein VFA93_00435 [Patescibacteria group bacterium]|nr:hypothetical protein [Patescibacteria group bacterium]
MKKIIFLFGILYFVLNVNSYAASPTPTPTKPAIEQQIDDLKDRIASRVAQLKLVEKRGIMGTVTDVSDTQLTLKDVKGDTRFVDVDELTKFIGTTKSGEALGISDIKKGQDVGVMGLYNKQSRRILARVIEIKVNPKMLGGSIATIDSDNFIIHVATDNGDQVQVEFETTTKTVSFTKSGGKLVRSGFSKLLVGESVFVVGFLDKTVKDQVDADKVIVLPDFVKAPSLPSSPPIVPSTGSGKKLTPITR